MRVVSLSYLMTRTDHPRLAESDERASSNVSLDSDVSVFESMYQEG